MVTIIVLSLFGIMAGSPGEQVGNTYFDFQANGNMGQRIAVDDTNQVYVVWMYCGGEYPGNPRFARCNFRYPDGTWYGEIDIAPSMSGYVQLDIMRGDPGLEKRPVFAYHYNGYSWIEIDLGVTSSTEAYGHLWPYVACANDNNIILATGNVSIGADSHHLYLTTDEGATWQHLADFDSCTCLSQFVRASHNPGSQKVVHVWTQSIAMDFPGLLISHMACDVWYMLSNDNGVTWGVPVNVTNFLPPGQMVNGDSTPWAYADVNAVFDNTDKLHIAWGANLGYKLNDTLYYADHAKILHWDEMTDDLHVVSSPSWHYGDPEGWWLDVSAGFRQHTEIWRLPACGAQLVCDQSTGDLYCLWSGTADTTDYSAGGYFNSEIYASKSTDGGINWSDYVNLTNTPSPGAGPGDCFDEDYMTAWPSVHNDSIFVTYIEDKDAGAAIVDYTAWTDNPVRVWIFHKGLISGIEEGDAVRPDYAMPVLKVHPNPFKEITDIRYRPALLGKARPRIWDEKAKGRDTSLKIYDASGRLVRQYDNKTIGLSDHIFWDGTDQSGKKLPAGVYFVHVQSGDYSEIEKVVMLR